MKCETHDMTQDAPLDPDFDVQDFLPYLLSRAAELSSLEFQKLYKGRYGMLRAEWRVMFHLGVYGTLTAKEIGKRASLHKTKVSRAVAKLSDRRWITRARDEKDRRAEHLELTAAGLRVYEDLKAHAANHDAKLAEIFDENEIELLRRMLRQLAR